MRILVPQPGSVLSSECELLFGELANTYARPVVAVKRRAIARARQRIAGAIFRNKTSGVPALRHAAADWPGAPPNDYCGTTSGLSFGKPAITEGFTLRCCATKACGACVSQSDNDMSSKRSLRKISRKTRSVLPVFLM